MNDATNSVARMWLNSMTDFFKQTVLDQLSHFTLTEMLYTNPSKSFSLLPQLLTIYATLCVVHFRINSALGVKLSSFSQFQDSLSATDPGELLRLSKVRSMASTFFQNKTKKTVPIALLGILPLLLFSW